ncbi:uncharacterized protein N7496_012182 [Penicillium cataractarum]|uniref:Uncharacterized protein n=1 Tax=Penicillium cataractarum TaxID=2100454 RepID=A0A9W9UTL0_9EURO|nr:uncharacterized protein N7496_012182 [Penicillium cataractarum]KAJ5354970.1 hypothetical protein N7496_012182 [Penicillium cataractarum]
MNAHLLSAPSVERTAEPGQQRLVSSDSIEKIGEKLKTRRSIGTWISDWFVWEMFAIFVSTSLVVAIFIILARFDNQPQPTWKYVSLNSLISWLSTLSKTCILFAVSETLGQLKWVWFANKPRPIPDLRTFDAASRGYYGSAELIWRHYRSMFHGCSFTYG